MKWYYCLLPCLLLATSALAQPREFRGDFVETYLTDQRFLKTLPGRVQLDCGGQLCSKSKSVRIYVFRDGDKIRKFWSTDYCDVVFDEPENILACGRYGHTVYYDRNNRLLLRDHRCRQHEERQVSGPVRPLLSLYRHASAPRRR